MMARITTIPKFIKTRYSFQVATIGFGDVTAWLFWSPATSNLDSFLYNEFFGTKCKRYYVSKNFYRFVGLPLAFHDASENKTTIILISGDKTGLKSCATDRIGHRHSIQQLLTSENCTDKGIVNGTNVVIVPPDSVLTLYQKN